MMGDIMEGFENKGKSVHPHMFSGLNGDLLRRINLFKFIRDFIRSSSVGNGYYMEFGVLHGESMIDAYRQLRGYITHMFGFDSFEGLPFEEKDLKSIKIMPSFCKGNFKSMKFDYVKQNIINSANVPEDKLSLIKGFFNQTLANFDDALLKNKGKLLCAYIDCDIYSSTLDVLKFLGDKITTGTWLLLDDYWCYRGSPKYGERRAFEEWIKKNNRIGVSEYCNFNGYGKAFIAYEK